MVQQLNWELSHKDMIFSKNCIQLTKVVGQGRLSLNKANYVLTFCMFSCTGESGLVYCAYLDSGNGRDMVAVKTCKGNK